MTLAACLQLTSQPLLAHAHWEASQTFSHLLCPSQQLSLASIGDATPKSWPSTPLGLQHMLWFLLGRVRYCCGLRVPGMSCLILPLPTAPPSTPTCNVGVWSPSMFSPRPSRLLAYQSSGAASPPHPHSSPLPSPSSLLPTWPGLCMVKREGGREGGWVGEWVGGWVMIFTVVAHCKVPTDWQDVNTIPLRTHRWAQTHHHQVCCFQGR